MKLNDFDKRNIFQVVGILAVVSGILYITIVHFLFDLPEEIAHGNEILIFMPGVAQILFAPILYYVGSKMDEKL